MNARGEAAAGARGGQAHSTRERGGDAGARALRSLWVAVAPGELNLHQDTAMFVLTTVGAREAAGQRTADDAAVCVRADPARAARRPVRIVIRPASLKAPPPWPFPLRVSLQ